MFNDKNKSKKYILAISVVLGIIAILWLFCGPFMNGVIKPKLVNKINSNKSVKLSVDDLHYNLLSNSFHFSQSSITKIYNPSSSIDTLIIIVPKISISNINWFKYIFSNDYSLGKISIDYPSVRIVEKKSNNGNTNSKDKKSFNIKSIKKFPLNCDQLVITEGTYTRENSHLQIIDSVKSFSIRLSDIELDSTDKNNSNIISDFSIKANGIYKLFVDDGYRLKVDSISFSEDENSLKIKAINFEPYITDEQFFDRKKYRTDRYVLDLNDFEIKDVDIASLVNKGDIIIDEIKINNFYWDILTPKYMPIEPAYNPQMPNEIFKSIERKIDINIISVSNGNLVVQSGYDYSKKPAKLSFTNVKAEIKNVSNIKNKQGENNPCTIDAAANIADAGRLTVKMNLPLLSKKFSMNYSGSLSSMNPERLNSQLMVANLVKIVSGKIDSVDFAVEVENGLSTARAHAFYDNLKIEKIKKEGLNTQPENSSLQTFLTNQFIIRHSNPNEKGKEKSGRFYYSRKNDDAFMDIVWLSVKGALGDIIGF